MGDRVQFAAHLQVLLDLLGEGDPSAIERIMEHSYQRLGALTARMLRDYPKLQRWEHTEDVLQDAMLRLQRSLAQVQPQSVAQFFGLAATQIRRCLIDLLRHYFGPEGPGIYPHTDVCKVDGAASLEPTTMRAWAEFYEALDALPNDERETVDLLWFQGFTQAQAAVILGVSERTVRRRWYSARYLLYKALRGEAPQ